MLKQKVFIYLRSQKTLLSLESNRIEMKLINTELLDCITEKAKESSRKRMNHNFHETLDDPINRLINVIEPDSYVPPHRHLNPDKPEIAIILRGKAASLTFDNNGNILECIILDPSTGNYGMEIEPGTWHSLLVLESGTAMYEVKPGPFAPLSPDNFAPWAPAASDEQAAKEYMEKIRTYVNNKA